MGSAKQKDFEDLSSIEQAAIFCNYLSAEARKEIFKHLDDFESKQLLMAMKDIQSISVQVNKLVLEEMLNKITEKEFLIFDRASNEKYLSDVLGSDRAKMIFGDNYQINNLSTLEAVDLRTLSNFLKGEHPQTVALILAHLDCQNQAKVMKVLPENLQTEVVLRITSLDHVSKDTLATLDKELGKEMAKYNNEMKKLGGVDAVAEMLNLIDKKVEKEILDKVQQTDPKLYEEIRAKMFVFDDLVFADEAGMKTLLTKVPQDVIVKCLKDCSKSLKEKFQKCLSKRAWDGIEDELKSMGQIKRSEVESAQNQLITEAKKLEAEGKLIIARFMGDIVE